MSFNQIDRLSKFGSRTLISAVILGGLLSACSPSSGTETPPRLPTLSVIPSNYPTISPTSAMSRVPTVESRTTGSVIRAMTQQELIDVMNSKIENSKDKIGIIIPLKEPVPVASLTLVGACVGGGCLPVETVAGSGLINAVAMTVGTAAEIGYAAVPIMGYLAPISMVLGNSVQGAMEGHYELNPTSGQFEQVNSLQGQYNRAKAVIEFFRGGVKFQGKEIARVGTGVQTDAVSVANPEAPSQALIKDQVEDAMQFLNEQSEDMRSFAEQLTYAKSKFSEMIKDLTLNNQVGENVLAISRLDQAVKNLANYGSRSIHDSLNPKREPPKDLKDLCKEAMDRVINATAPVNKIDIENSKPIVKIPEFSAIDPNISIPHDRVVLLNRSYMWIDALDWMVNNCQAYYRFEAKSDYVTDSDLRLTDQDRREFNMWGNDQLTGYISITPR
jgi:hypothetical protein